MAYLEMTRLSKTFAHADVPAVDGLSLQAERGDFVAIIGPSGCGKSTTLRLVAGLETPDAGTVRVDGRDVTALPPSERDVAMVFQDFALYPHLSVYENIAFPLKARRTPRREVAERVRETAGLLGIEELRAASLLSFSGGQKQRVALGRALVRKPALFLMDEPLSNLDAHLRAQMRGELARLHRETGATILYVTHDRTEARALATKAVVMDHGRVQQVGTPDDLRRHPRNAFVAGFMNAPL